MSCRKAKQALKYQGGHKRIAGRRVPVVRNDIKEDTQSVQRVLLNRRPAREGAVAFQMKCQTHAVQTRIL